MNDTSEKMALMFAERHRQMTPEMRLRIASQMFDTARTIVESSLPAHLSRQERRLALAERLYANELPRAALLAFATYDVTANTEYPINSEPLGSLKEIG